MDGLTFLSVILALAILAIPIAVVALLISVSRLKNRVALLELRLDEVQAEAPAAVQEREMQDGAEPIRNPISDTPTVDAAGKAQAALENPAVSETSDLIVSGDWSEPAPVVVAPQPAEPGRIAQLAEWLKQNWVYAVSALSLALAGIFFVQYGIEKGLLPPAVRVMTAIIFGLVLIGAGEFLRRRWGDRDGDVTAYLPSTFSGAGLVSAFAGILAARQLYGLIGPELALAGLVATALLAVVLGWFYGPFLVSIGLLGATAAPFVIGGDSDNVAWLYGYFCVIAGLGLAVDAIRRWAWVSVLALVLGHSGAGLLLAGSGGAGWYAMALVALAVMAICIPAKSVMPDHQGEMLASSIGVPTAPKPAFPTWLAAGALAASSVILMLLPVKNADEGMLVIVALATLGLLLILWSSRGAPALSDLTILPVAGFLMRLGFEGFAGWPLAREFANYAIELRAPETAPPFTASMLLALATAMSVAAALSSNAAGRLKPFWAAGAAITAPVAALVLELLWSPSSVLGAYPWALHVIGLAALMVMLALYFARADGDDMRRAAYASLSALSLIALALFLVATKAALTLALAVLVVVAATLDRRFRLPEMGWFIQAGVIVLSWRLVVDPGLEWAVDVAALWEVFASFGSAILAMATALWLLQGIDRRSVRAILESALAAYAALFANVLIQRWLMAGGDDNWAFTHWGFALHAMPWLVLMLTQFYRLQLQGALKRLRWVVGLAAGAIGLGGLGLAVLPGNPLFGVMGREYDRVYGPQVFDTLLLAYGLPGLMLAATMLKMPHLPIWLHRGLTGIGAALMGLFAALEIRRFWQGDDLSVPGVTQYELYSYTIALMTLGAALLYQAIARRSKSLRRIAMAVIGLTIAKVFLIDISGLSGLTRVFSFLALGLSLAGLALLNRWAIARQAEDPDADGTAT